MSKTDRKEIRYADGPQNSAKAYPGKKSRNNPNGTALTKSEFIASEVEKWVRHFDNSDLYHQTFFAHKVTYLQRYLKKLYVSRKEASEKLIEIETKVALESEEDVLTNSQSLIGGDMDVDFGFDGDMDNEDTDDNIEDQSRWDKENMLNRILSLTDEQLFGGNMVVNDTVKNTYKYKQRESEFYLTKSDEELFGMYDKLPPHIKSREEFKQRHNEYVEGYMEENFAMASSQDILLKLSQTPAAVQASDIYKERLSHLSFQDISLRLLLKNIKETILELKKTPEGKKQAKLFIAGVSHPVFGDPGLDLDERTRKEVKTIKANLLKGTSTTLKGLDHKRRSEFPETVKMIARNHWIENTIPEPAKHSGRALEVEDETVPTRYQDKTDNEFYENFKEDCKEEIKGEMAKEGEKIVKNLEGRPDSEDKQRRLIYAQNLSERFVNTYY